MLKIHSINFLQKILHPFRGRKPCKRSERRLQSVMSFCRQSQLLAQIFFVMFSCLFVTFSCRQNIHCKHFFYIRTRFFPLKLDVFIIQTQSTYTHSWNGQTPKYTHPEPERLPHNQQTSYFLLL